MKIIRALGYVAIATLCGSLVWLGGWLYMNREFVDPTALTGNDALSAQAAWAQAILSVLAVLVAIWVARAQAKQSRKLVEDELARVRMKEREESWERQSLARTALKDMFENGSEAIALLNSEDDGEWHVALMKIESGANSAAQHFLRVSSVLKQTPSGSLHCFHIEEALSKFSRGRAEFFDPLLIRIPLGTKIFNLVPQPEVAKAVAVKIREEIDSLFGHVSRL